jgi:hypothetical protein
MNTAAKLGVYVLGLAVVFGGALGVGSAVGEVGPAPVKEESHAAMESDAAASADTPGAAASAASADTPGGLQMSENGYTLTPLTTAITPGVPVDFRFQVTGPGGEPVTDYQVEHDKKLHFIVASRDLTSFQHVHPVEAGGGVWSIKLTLPEAGAYRAFADFVPAGGSGLTLGTDLLVPGDYQPKALPQVSRTSTVDGYTVSLSGDLVPGRASKLTLSVSKDGKPVTDLQPYLGAYGHLVALRARDLAYLHVHPQSTGTAGPEITFYAEVPSAGDYRLFLDFQHQGTVRTADFTATAAPAPVGSPSGESDAHGH